MVLYRLLGWVGLAVAVVWCVLSVLALVDAIEGYETARFILGLACMSLLLYTQVFLRPKLEGKGP